MMGYRRIKHRGGGVNLDIVWSNLILTLIIFGILVVLIFKGISLLVRSYKSKK